jgi:PAS domain S-box-containing protein
MGRAWSAHVQFFSQGSGELFCASRYKLWRLIGEPSIVSRLAPASSGRERWVAVEGTVMRGEDGRSVQLRGVTRDTTERKHAEARLPESARLSRELLGALPAAIYVTDATGRITYCNQAAIDLWGVEPKLGEDKWSNFSRFYHTDGRPMALADGPTEIALKQGRRVQDQDAILERMDGTRISIAPYATPVRDSTGAVVGVINMTVDISERRKAELALAERDAQLAMAGRAALIGSYSYDIGTELMEVSEGYVTAHGLSEGAKKTTRSEWRYRVHPEDLLRIEKMRAEAFRKRSGEYDVEYRILRPDGEVRWIESRSFIAFDGEGRPRRVVGVNIDITERKQTEQALADRNKQLELAGKVAGVGTFAINVNAAWETTAQTMQISPGFAAIYGFSEETVEVSVGDWRSRVYPGDLAQFLTIRHEAFAEQRSESHLEYRIVRPCGEIRWIESRTFIEYDQGGHAKRLVGVNIDATERKKLEEQRKVLVAELDHRVKNALATVSAVVSRTVEGSRSTGDFLEALDGRIRSMATTHELLSARRWQGISLTKLVRGGLAPYATSSNTEIEGAEVVLPADVGQPMAMVLHELVTNAAKYGSLSTQSGRVSIRWDRRVNGHSRPHLVLEWQEIGGPPVVAPDKPGYGMSIIRGLLPYECSATVDLVLAPEGVRCRLEVPAEWFRSPSESVSEVGALTPLRTVDT